MVGEKQLKILRLKAVKERVGLSTATIYAMVQRGEFPRQVKIGPRAVGWLDSQVEGFIAQRVCASIDRTTV